MTGDRDQRARQPPRHVFDEARLAAPRRAFQHHRQLGAIGRFKKFNFIGDLSWLRGTVTRKFEEGGRRGVEVALEITNQRDERTTHGTASVLLPSRVHGPVAFA